MADRGQTSPAAPATPRPGQTAMSWPVLAAVAAGGALGALARAGLLAATPQHPATADWGTVLVNVLGGALIGVLMETLTRRPNPHPLLRPFLGVGVLGGFTTFSAAITDATDAFAAHQPGEALLAIAANLIGALLAVSAAAGATATLLDRAAQRKKT